MKNIQISTYSAPNWEAKVTGSVVIRNDTEAQYYVDNVGVVNMQPVGLFTIITCVDNATHYVLTAFLRQANRTSSTE